MEIFSRPPPQLFLFHVLCNEVLPCVLETRPPPITLNNLELGVLFFNLHDVDVVLHSTASFVFASASPHHLCEFAAQP